MAARQSRDGVSVTEGMLESYEQQRRAIASRMEAATVWIVVEDEENICTGSGFVVADGYIATNAHVISCADQAEIHVMNSLLPLTEAFLVNAEIDKKTPSGNDFALLRFTPPAGVSLPALSFNLDVRRMDRVSAWGYPGIVTQFDKSLHALQNGDYEAIGLPPVVYTEGTVSALVEDRGYSIIHTASIAAGNSGGPLINRKAEVVGINTWGYTEEGEGAFVNAALTATELVAFLRKNNIQPLLSPPSEKHQSGFIAQAGRSALAQQPVEQPKGATDNAPGPKDPRVTSTEAAKVLRLAQNGDSDAMTVAGIGYLNGEDGFPQDNEYALLWLKKAASAGDPDAQGLLGMLHIVLEEIHDPEYGLALLRKSASAENADSDIQALLAEFLYEGESFGIAADYNESLHWARISAGAGGASGKAILGLHYYDGVAVTKNHAKALSLGREAAREGDAKGKALLARLRYENEEFSDNPRAVIDLALDAAESGERIAQGLLAYIYAFEKKYANPIAAEKYARLAALQADPLGYYVLGWLYSKGRVVEKDLGMAWAYLDLSSRLMEEPQGNHGENIEKSPLKTVEALLSAKEKKRAAELQKTWYADWGLQVPPR